MGRRSAKVCLTQIEQLCLNINGIISHYHTVRIQHTIIAFTRFRKGPNFYCYFLSIQRQSQSRPLESVFDPNRTTMLMPFASGIATPIQSKTGFGYILGETYNDYVGGVALICIAVMMFWQVEGKPLMDLQELSSEFQWGPYLCISYLMPLASTIRACKICT